MKQLKLSLELEASSPPPVALDPKTQAELVDQLAQAITAVEQKQQEKTHEGTSPAS